MTDNRVTITDVLEATCAAITHHAELAVLANREAIEQGLDLEPTTDHESLNRLALVLDDLLAEAGPGRRYVDASIELAAVKLVLG